MVCCNFILPETANYVSFSAYSILRILFYTTLRYADYFDVSLDYLYGRTDDPRGKVYSNEPDLGKLHPEMNEFIEMCFDPKSPMNKRLKKTLVQMLEEETK